MVDTFIPGYESSITLDSVTMDAHVESFDINRQKNLIEKPVLGEQTPPSIVGQRTVELTITGHGSVEAVPALEAVYAKDVPVPYTIQLGNDAGATDAGSYAGNGLVTGFNTTNPAADEVGFTITIRGTDEPAYTPATP